jgi:hypothetical protein
MIKIKVNYIGINESSQLLVQRKYPQSRCCFMENLQTPLATMMHLAEGVCFNALFTLKAENSLICRLE